MDTSQRERFFDVRLPRWYRIASWIVRGFGFLLFLTGSWQMTHQDLGGSPWPAVSLWVGMLLLVLPSLPKAYIEQRNRWRGLRDGTFQEHLDSQKTKENDKTLE